MYYSESCLCINAAGISDKEDEQPSSKNPFADHIPSFSPLDLTSKKEKAIMYCKQFLLSLIEPPIEEHLLQNTLWPETQKL